ncbi:MULTISPECIES: holo-ACP synthase [unclassified Saccharothrix]|uniref:holo-ACP synthase n=1 Tax=unclassified Saccharothrix TaxID=2593673 RepID=UPI00307F20DE
MRIGVDLLKLPRFARVAEHPRMRRLLFTERELGDVADLGPARRVERLGGRFCAKEAVAKVLGRGLGQGLRWPEIEVTSDEWGAPAVRLHGGAAEAARTAGIGSVQVSITHQEDLVVCVALGVPHGPDRGA